MIGKAGIKGRLVAPPRHRRKMFPDHPVARVRLGLTHVAASLVVADEVRDLPGFPLPQLRADPGVEPDCGGS